MCLSFGFGLELFTAPASLNMIANQRRREFRALKHAKTGSDIGSDHVARKKVSLFGVLMLERISLLKDSPRNTEAPKSEMHGLTLNNIKVVTYCTSQVKIISTAFLQGSNAH